MCKNNNQLYFMKAWAKMPLSEEQLHSIPKSHQQRPYLLCYEKDDCFYAFPMSSKIFRDNIRYENSKVLINSYIDYFRTKARIDLSNFTILPKKNLIDSPTVLDSRYNSEIIKKMKANFKYCNYPLVFISYINELDFEYERNDLVKICNKKFVIISEPLNGKIYALEVYCYPVNGCVEKITDALKYYVDVENIQKLNVEEIEEYCTKLYGFATVSNSLKDTRRQFRMMSKIYINNDFSKLDNLYVGTIISYKVDNEIKKMIILEKEKNLLTVIVGLDNQMYSEFKVGYISSNLSFDFNIEGILSDERLEQIKYKKLNLNNNLLIKVKK